MVTHTTQAIVITNFLEPLAAGQQGFSTIMLVVDQATNTLNGARTVEYSSKDEISTAETSGHISAATSTLAKVMFDQVPIPSSVKVGRVDTGGGETWAQGYAAIKAADPDFYGVVSATRTVADAASLANAVNSDTDGRVCIVQSSDTDLLTATIPSEFSSISNPERVVVLFHDTNAQALGEGYASAWLSWDPDEKAVGTVRRVRGVEPYATDITLTQYNQALANNVNIAAPFSSAQTFIREGVALSGRPAYQVLTADWFKARVREDVAAVKLAASDRGDRIPVSEVGQQLIVGTVVARGRRGEDAGHFVRDSVICTPYAITDADKAANRLRFRVEGTYALDATNFAFDIYYGT